MTNKRLRLLLFKAAAHTYMQSAAYNKHFQFTTFLALSFMIRPQPQPTTLSNKTVHSPLPPSKATARLHGIEKSNTNFHISNSLILPLFFLLLFSKPNHKPSCLDTGAKRHVQLNIWY